MMKKTMMFSLALAMMMPVMSWAQTPEEMGLAIAVEADKRDTGFGDQVVEMKMILKNQHGQESVRDLRLKTLEVKGDGDKSFSIFDRPRDVKGTALLTFTHKTAPDDQWLYLPALKRVKRISSANKSGPFMGSEFAFEDLSSQEVEKYTYKLIDEVALNGEAHFLIERYPNDKNSGYTRQEVWMHKATYRPTQIIYYDRKNAKLKTQTFSGYKQYLKQFWRADEIVMENHQSGKSTRLEWKNYRFRTGLSDRDFNKNALKRAK